MKEIKCRISTVKKLSDEVLYIDIKPNQEIFLEDFNELKKAALNLGEGRSFYNLINVGNNTLADKATREVSCSIEGSYYKKADAYIVYSLAQKIMGNIMLKINRPVVPTKFFTSEEDAKKWLRSLQKAENRIPSLS